MKKELQDKLFEKYPKLFKQKDLTVQQSCMPWGICTGNGWYNLLEGLCEEINQYLEWRKEDENVTQVEFAQIKQKFGLLRVVHDGGDDTLNGYITALISMAERASSHICEICGNKGSIGGKSWISVKCPKHRNAVRMKKNDKNDKKGAISLDFDGVCNSYKSGFVAIDDIPDPPVTGSLEFIRKALDDGFKVYIFSTRNRDDQGKRAIYKWFVEHGLEDSYLNQLSFPEEKPIAKVYIDDRAWEFNGEFPELEEIDQFRPWHGGKSSSQK